MDHHKISLNVHLQVPTTAPVSQDGSHTPNTPEIVNSIVNMTSGPFSSTVEPHVITAAPPAEIPTMTVTAPPENFQEGLTYADISMDSISSSSSVATNLSSPSTPGSAMSIQAYTSQFIKEGLKIKMRQKIGSNSATTFSQAQDKFEQTLLQGTSRPTKTKRIKYESNLTDNDVQKRLRRRERNKIAATKCRNKKKARTQNLMKESEILDAQNKSLKVEINKLEAEKTRLLALLSSHEPTCERKLKDIMKTKQEFDYQQPEFRVPLPPARINPQPPTFAEAIRMASEAVKEEEEEMPNFSDEMAAYLTEGNTYFHHHQQSDSNHFLAKRTLGQTYLDLDSRCIAL